MDQEQELQFAGFFSILKKSFTIIFSWRKIFSQITIYLVLPLSFVFLAHIQLSQLLFFKIFRTHHTLYFYNIEPGTVYAKFSRMISSEWTAFWLFKIAYFLFVLIFSLLSTAAVVYTVACIYTSKPITFKKVTSVVAKVWKRLIVTLLWSFAFVFVYNIIAGAVFIAACVALYRANRSIAVAVLLALLFLYLVGLLYITIVWHLASVVSVLEEVYGIKALIKSKNLIKGKLWVAIALFVLIGIFFFGIQMVFEIFVVFGWPEEVGMRILIGIFCLLLMVKLILVVLVIQTVLYFVCKSYHHQIIDKSSLSDHLEAYTGDYLPLKASNVQMEQVQQ
ncbi:uncharacterized protein LOC126656880 [Mercurialis annua]|uniref:uncharacterized protein LOC126656880 n=1 Tax=Mercurialis annua TaxID=3986 RepID=UPI00215F37D4|nr:uncharacterized protein LOC126656880 [Mercurialis annua]